MTPTMIRKTVPFLSITIVLLASQPLSAKKRIPPGGRIAIVADERLAALRNAPNLSGSVVDAWYQCAIPGAAVKASFFIEW